MIVKLRDIMNHHAFVLKLDIHAHCPRTCKQHVIYFEIAVQPTPWHQMFRDGAACFSQAANGPFDNWM
jgi:hypothetical protein